MNGKIGSAAAPSMTMEDAMAAIAAMTAPKVTKELIDGKIVDVAYFNEGTLTICTIEMLNGFQFVGTSACVSVENFNADVGRRLAYDDSFKKIWSHEAYLLAERIYFASSRDTAADPAPLQTVRDLTDDEKAGLANGTLVLKDGMPVPAAPVPATSAAAATGTGAVELDPVTGQQVAKPSETV